MKRIFINFILSLLLITLAGIYLTRKTEEDSHLVRTSINGTEGILTDSHLVRTSINGTEGILTECSDCMPKPWLKSCPVPGMLLWVKDAETANKEPEKALHSLPPNLVVKQSGIPDGGLGVWAEVNFPKCTVFGPYGGEIIPIESTVNISGRYAWQITIDGEPAHWVDGANKSFSNWMRYINSANKKVDRNLQPFQSKDEIYYLVRKPIESVMDLVQKCEMYMYTIDIGPLEMAENYFLHRNNSEESILDHACPVVVLVVMEYMATESMEELYAVTDSLLPLMEEAMCVSVVLNRELMEKAAENGQFSMDDRFEKVEQGEQALLDQCMHEFGKGDLVDLTDDLVEKLLLDGDKDK